MAIIDRSSDITQYMTGGSFDRLIKDFGCDSPSELVQILGLAPDSTVLDLCGGFSNATEQLQKLGFFTVLADLQIDRRKAAVAMMKVRAEYAAACALKVTKVANTFSGQDRPIAEALASVLMPLIHRQPDKDDKPAFNRIMKLLTAGRLTAVTCDFTVGLPFADETFDLVVSRKGLTVYSPPEQEVGILEEVRRILRPGGRLALTPLILEPEFPDDSGAITWGFDLIEGAVNGFGGSIVRVNDTGYANQVSALIQLK